MKPKTKMKKLRITEADFMLAQRRAARLEEIAEHGRPVSFRKAVRMVKDTIQTTVLDEKYSRQGCDRDAVEHYLKACKLTPSYWHRGNLDPEISALIRRYDLTKD